MTKTLTPSDLKKLTEEYRQKGYYVIYQWCYSYYVFNTVPHNFSFGDGEDNYSVDQWRANIEANFATSLDEMEWKEKIEKFNANRTHFSSDSHHRDYFL